MKKILFTHSYFYKMDPKQWKAQMPYPPLGTIYAAALLRENGFEVNLFDTALRDSPRDLEEILDKEKPGFLVIYDDGFNYLTKMCLTNMREAAFEMIRYAKERNINVIVTSSDAADHYEKYLHAGADIVIYGEAELTLLELVSEISGPIDWLVMENINGIYFKKDGKIHQTQPRKVLNDLDSLPLPAWDLVDVEAYRRVWKNSGKEFTMHLATTRGCPFHCNWCAKPIYGQRYNSHSPGRVVEMIELLVNRYQVRRFWMADDIFGLKPGWVQEFNRILKEKRLKIKYYIQSRADLLLKDDTIEALVESGLEEVWIGAESGSQKILDAMDKGIRIEQIEQATHLLQSKGVKVAFFIQYGYLGETKEDIEKTIRLIKRLVPDNIGVSVSYPLPGTPFYEKVKDQFSGKTNWTDSDDLAMLFRGTFNGKFYKKLQRYTHKIHRIALGKKKIKKLLRHPFEMNKEDYYSILKLPYYVPMALYDKIQLNRMENVN